MSQIIRWTITHVAPLFLVTAPITSYADQIYSIYRTRSSAGFSLDIPLIMLVASVLKIFYWQTARFEISLLLQAIIMIFMQFLLLHYSLRYRSFSATAAKPFAGLQDGESSGTRPYNFWQWRSERPYWLAVLYYMIALVVLQLLFGWSTWYSLIQGYVALSVEATLPLPQVLANERAQSCKGFRLSVLINWLLGDAMKMTYFFMAESPIPWAFKLCGLFQSACDAYLGIQYWKFEVARNLVNVEDGVIKEGAVEQELDARWKPAKDPKHP